MLELGNSIGSFSVTAGDTERTNGQAVLRGSKRFACAQYLFGSPAQDAKALNALFTKTARVPLAKTADL